MTASVVEQQRASMVAAAEVVPRVVRQPAAELAAAAKLNEPETEAPKPSSSSNQRSLAAATLAAPQVASRVAQPRAAQSVAQPQAALLVESEALVAHLKLNSNPTPRSCRDRNSVATAPAARAK